MRSSLVAAALLLVSCTTPARPSGAELQAFRTVLSDHSRDVSRAGRRSEAAEHRWTEISRHYRRAKHDFVRAEAEFARVRRDRRSERGTLEEASQAFRAARARWEHVQIAIVIAAALDARALDAKRSPRARLQACDPPMSTRVFRYAAAAAGIIISGRDVDHILPVAHGGADHPDNYRLVDSAENRRWGASWGAAKCRDVGSEACKRAVAVSRRCGSYTGDVPGL